jgi:HK97 gp10 family phage protein
MRVTVKIEGIRECEAMLAELTDATGRNVLRRALRAAAVPIIEAAQSRVPVDTGEMKIGISVQSTAKRAKKRKDADATVFIGVAGKHASLAHLVEFGTASHGKSGGPLPPRPFMRPAWDSKGAEAFDVFRRELRAHVEKALAKHRKRQAKIAAAK